MMPVDAMLVVDRGNENCETASNVLRKDEAVSLLDLLVRKEVKRRIRGIAYESGPSAIGVKRSFMLRVRSASP